MADYPRTPTAAEVGADPAGTAAAAVAAHEADTTAVHGIADTSALVLTSDARLSDARTPTAHASTHAAGQADAVAPLGIGARPLSDARFSEQALYFDFSDASMFNSSRGEWTTSGASAPSVTGGYMTAAATGEGYAYRAAEQFTDGEVVVKYRTAASPADAGILLRTRGTNNLVLVGPTGARISVWVRTSGTWNELAYTLHTLSANTDYWIRARCEGNTITGEMFAADPATGEVPLSTVRHTLSGAFATNHGAGVKGAAGLYWSAGGASNLGFRYDDLYIRPMPRPLTSYARLQHGQIGVPLYTPQVVHAMPADAIDSNAAQLITGLVYLRIFQAPATITLTKAAYLIGSANGVTPTAFRMGLYEVDPITFKGSLVARTADDPTGLTAGTYTEVERAFSTTGGYPSSYTIREGRWYGSGIVGAAATMPRAHGKVYVVYTTPTAIGWSNYTSDLPTTFSSDYAAHGWFLTGSPSPAVYFTE